MTSEEVLATVSSAGENLVTALQTATDESQVAESIDTALDHLATTGVWGTDNRLPSTRLWDIAGPWLQHGALLHRARFKPRGYAGDDEMLRLIAENWRGSHPFGQHLDAYFQAHAAPQAVRNRTQIVADIIVDAVCRSPGQPVRFASVGSGPAIDVMRGAQRLSALEREQLVVTLLDLDPRALETAQERLAPLLPPPNLRTARENLYRLPGHAQADRLLEADVIACTGFFDYLNDVDAAALLKLFWDALRPGGRMVVFNFAPDNPSRGLMEWIGNWYLVYRTRADMQALARKAEIPDDAFVIAAEEQGINLYIDARRRVASSP